jgi:hypothetical protein
MPSGGGGGGDAPVVEGRVEWPRAVTAGERSPGVQIHVTSKNIV